MSFSTGWIGRRQVRMVAAWSLVLSSVAAAAFAEPLFRAPYLSYDLGPSQSRTVLCDMNGDGHLDIVATNEDSNTVSILRGRDHDGFAPRRSFAAGLAPLYLTTADVDLDGRADVIVSQWPGAIAILLGENDASLAAPAVYETGGGDPIQIAAGDVTGDGAPDLAVACYESPLRLLTGDGLGGFGPSQALGVSAQAVTIADVNQDGHLDLICTESTFLHILLGQGDGTFKPEEALPMASLATMIVADDLNGDGRLDLTASCYVGAIVSVFLAAPAGGFLPRYDQPCAPYPTSICFHDLDLDGRLDLISCSYSFQNVLVRWGHGDGTFGAPATYAVVENPSSLAAADLNDDGRPDLAVGTGTEIAALAVVFQNESGAFTNGSSFATQPMGSELTSADLNRDGLTDIAYASFSSVIVAYGSPGGTFASGVSLGLSAIPSDILLADLNGDQRLDMVVANSAPNKIAVFLQQASGGFGLRQDYTAGTGPQQTALGDVNSDGRADLVVANFNSAFSIFLGHGDGTFDPKIDRGRPADAVSLADLNGDGKLDLVYTGYPNLLFARLGIGNASFGIEFSYPTAPDPKQLRVVDMDRDGYLDAVTNSSTDRISVRRGLGNGTFGSVTHVEVGDDPRSILVADLDRDGQLDVAASCLVGRVVSVLLGQADGSLGARQDYGTGDSPSAVTTLASNILGCPDVAVGNFLSRTATRLVNLMQPIDVLVQDLRAEWQGEGVHIAWALSNDAVRSMQSVKVQRSETAPGPYVDRSAGLAPARWMSFDDGEPLERQACWYRLILIDREGTETASKPTFGERPVHRDLVLEVGRNAVGDFEIQYEAGALSTAARLALFDSRGRLLRVLVQGPMAPGRHLCTWNRRTDAGARVSHGVYFVQLEDNGRRATRKLVLAGFSPR